MMRAAIGLLLVDVLVGCARTHLAREAGAAGTPVRDDSHGGSGGRSALDDEDLFGSSSGTQDASTDPNANDEALPPPVEMPPDDVTTETWIGELWSVVPVLCDPDASSRDTSGVQPTGYREPVVMVLDPGGELEFPSGELAFGYSALPQEPDIEARVTRDDAYCSCTKQFFSKRGAYFFGYERTEDRMIFDISPGASRASGCDDFHGGPITLDLAIRGDAMEGTLLHAALGTSSELRLQRMR